MAQNEQLFFESIAQRVSQATQQPILCTQVHSFHPQLTAAKFELQNQLKIILMPDVRSPTFTYQTWFRVGSKHENPNRTGLAHFFEHLCFKGTETYPLGTFDKEMERRGSQTNAATWVDWTYYTESLASRGHHLETVIQFESDRMHRLIIDEATSSSEREVVKNERRMTVEDSVGGTLSEKLFELAYTEHPYRWPTIGSMQHLEATSVSELRAFYQHYYAPNNATIVITGDIHVEQTLALLCQYYGPIQAQKIAPYHPEQEPEQTEARYLVLHKPLQTAQMMIGYKIPAQNHPHYAGIEILNDILTEGDTARLYRALVCEEQIASDVSGFVTPFSEPGLIEFHLTLCEDVKPEYALKVFQETLNHLQNGIETYELEKAQHSLELAMLEEMQETESCAEQLGHFETNYNDFTQAFQYQAYQHYNEQTLLDIAKSIFNVHHRTTVVAIPETKHD